MGTNVTSALNGSRCKGRNRQGEPCQRRASRDGYCSVHHPLGQDMRALGRKGGSRSPMTKLRAAADDDLREKAKAALVDALEGDDERRRFEAAKSLFSFRATPPPADQQPGANSAPVLADGRKVVGLADVLELCVEKEGIRGVLDSARMQDVILRAAEQVRELQAAGVRVETPNP